MAKKAKRSERAKDTWNSISGIMTVYGNTFEDRKGRDYISWSATVGKKNDDDEYDNYYFRVRFAKDANAPETDGLHQIDIQSGFISLETYTKKKQEITVPVIVIVEDEVLDDIGKKKKSDADEEDEEMKSLPKKSKKKKKDEDEEDEDDEDDLPF